jgi:riboflavin kinase / FMN adenylyltransferase
VFDGVHRGHQALFDELRAWAREAGVDPVAVTLWPHPRGVLGEKAPPLLTSLEHRLVLLERAAVGVVLLHFDPEVAALTAAEFLERVVVDGLGASRLLLGHDNRLGKDRLGDLKALQGLGAARGLEFRGAAAREVEVPGRGKVLVSSTAVRDAMARGALDETAALLGRPPSVLGTVVEGDKRGRTLGFPTANLDLGPAMRPPRGVWATWARLVRADGGSGAKLPSVTNVGRRPTFKPDDPDLVECHLLQGSGDCYGQRLELELVAKLRDEQKFDGPDQLKAQIARDCEAALKALGR